MQEVKVSASSIEPFAELCGRSSVESVTRLAATIRGALGTRAIWNINSTASGGGVAEMLRSLLRYARGVGVDVRWLVLDGPPQFFRITKRIHNALHDSPGDNSQLGASEALLYEKVLQDNIIQLDAFVRRNDIVICHDPQTAGLVPHLLNRGCLVVWRCHIGHEGHTSEVDGGWAFLRKYLENVPTAVFSRGAYAPEWLPKKRWLVLPPNIDPFAVKNAPLSEDACRAILGRVGIVDSEASSTPSPTYTLEDGSIGRVDHEAEVIRLGRAPSWNTPLVVQVSRWDAMKDPVGVLLGFARHVEPDAPRHAELVLAGPAISSVADDPESAQVFLAVEQAFRELPDALRRHIHLALLPMNDVDENSAIVNALQRHAAVIVQKSLKEGFGLTVTEAMWKDRPVLASAVGGIQDQIRDGVDGVLLRDPNDLRQFGELLKALLGDEARAAQLGRAGYERVRDNYLSITALENWGALVQQVLPIALPPEAPQAQPQA
jgi:trehalose synthase